MVDDKCDQVSTIFPKSKTIFPERPRHQQFPGQWVKPTPKRQRWNQRGKAGCPQCQRAAKRTNLLELSSGSEKWSCVEKKNLNWKNNLNGPNCFPELLHIRKGCPDIFITNLDPLCFVHNDYTWWSVPHSFTHPTNGHGAGQEEARAGIAEAGEQHVSSSGLGAGAPHPHSPVSSSSNKIHCGVPSGSHMLWIGGPRTIFKLY